MKFRGQAGSCRDCLNGAERFEIWEKRKVTEFDEDLPAGETDLNVSRLSGAQRQEDIGIQIPGICGSAYTADDAGVKEYVAFVQFIDRKRSSLLTAFSSREDNGLNIVGRARENASTSERDVAASACSRMHCADWYWQNLFCRVTRWTTLISSATCTARWKQRRIPLHRLGVMAASVLDARRIVVSGGCVDGSLRERVSKAGTVRYFLRESDRAITSTRIGSRNEIARRRSDILLSGNHAWARKKLCFTRPYLAEDGQAWDASLFWAEVTRLSGIKPGSVRGEVGEVDPARGRIES